VADWSDEEHHPAGVYLDLDPRRLRQGRLDVVSSRLHFGAATLFPQLSQRWDEGARDVVMTLWNAGLRFPALASRRAGEAVADRYGWTHPEEHRPGLYPDALAMVLEAQAADPWSMALVLERLHYEGYNYKDAQHAQTALGLLACRAYGSGRVEVGEVERGFLMGSISHGPMWGWAAGMAQDYTLQRRATAVESLGRTDPEAALHHAVDLAYDRRSTSQDVPGLFRPLAQRSSEPIWERLCDLHG
jgi:hypothetical protein